MGQYFIFEGNCATRAGKCDSLVPRGLPGRWKANREDGLSKESPQRRRDALAELP